MIFEQATHFSLTSVKPIDLASSSVETEIIITMYELIKNLTSTSVKMGEPIGAVIVQKMTSQTPSGVLMKRFSIPVIISLMLHVILLLVFVYLRQPVKPFGRRLILQLSSEHPDVYTSESSATQQQRPISPQSEMPVQKTPRVDPEAQFVKPELPEPSLTHHYETILIEREKKKQALMSLKMDESEQDSLFNRTIEALLRTQPESTIRSSPNDQIADLIQKRTEGSNPMMLSTDKLFGFPEGRQIESHPSQFNFMPSKVQVLSMAYLYEHREATQIDLYANIPVDEPITAEGMNQSLDQLVSKGLLTRQKVSPEQLFNFFGFPLEMSSKNRKNHIYKYTPSVDKQKIMAYLQSRLYLMREKLLTSPADSTSLKPRIKAIEENIRGLVKH